VTSVPLPEAKNPSAPVSHPGRIVLAAVFLIFAAVVIRTLANPNIRARLPIYLALEFLYLAPFTLALWRSIRKPLIQHLYFVYQSSIVLVLIALRPRFDFIVVLFVLLSFQAVLIFSGRARWIWVAALAMLTCIPMMVALGALLGLSLALMPMTIGIVFAAYAAVTQEIEAGLRTRQTLMAELENANRQLTVSLGQAEELSAIQERNRLARGLHDSVSQTMFSISLHVHATQILLQRDPERLRPQLEELKGLTQGALAEMRGLIAQLRPQEDTPVGRPTP
jgi:signal transduction histidine kinase